MVARHHQHTAYAALLLSRDGCRCGVHACLHGLVVMVRVVPLHVLGDAPSAIFWDVSHEVIAHLAVILLYLTNDVLPVLQGRLELHHEVPNR